MASSSASFGTGITDTVTMQVADTTTTDENDEDGETVMRITTVGAEAIPYFLGAVVDHNPSSVAEEIEVETSASLVGDEVEEEEDVSMEVQDEERGGQQQQDDIVKHACDLAAVGVEEQLGIQEEKTRSEDAVAEEPSQAEDEAEVTTTKESPKKRGKPGEIRESGGFTVKIMCGGGSTDGMGGSIEKSDDGDCMDIDLESCGESSAGGSGGSGREVEMKSAARVSCIQWASGGKRKQGGKGRRETLGGRSPTPSTSTATLAALKTSSFVTSPVFLKDEWGNEGDEEMVGAQNGEMSGISNASFVESQDVPPPPVQNNVALGPGPASQLQGSVTSLLTALQNPVGNTVLPCCCCVHPCCIVMRELFSSCFPLWSNQAQKRQDICCMPNDFPRRPPPPGFEDPPETEWITANVNHIDPSGSLRYKCRSCDGLVEYRSRRQKAFHLNFNRLRFECKKCHRRYLTNKQLMMHATRHNEKTRVCTFCDKRFLTQIELQNHLNTHTKARPYRCPICFRRFNQTTRYYAHIRDFHKKYECQDCYHSKVCAANSLKRSYRALTQGSPKPSTSFLARSSL